MAPKGQGADGSLQGCLFDPSEDAANDYFEQDLFVVTLNNIINPVDPEDLMPLVIEISQQGYIIASTNSYSIEGELFDEYDGIEIISVTHSNKTLGAYNEVEIVFTAEIPLPD